MTKPAHHPHCRYPLIGLTNLLLLFFAGLLQGASPSGSSPSPQNMPAAGLTLSIQDDNTKNLRPLRPLHGINKGPLTQGGLINLTSQHRDLHIPSVRLHDCQWPYPDVVDHHAIFRQPNADPLAPLSYDFKLTDDFLESVVAVGAQVVYRLGESIEHGRVKRFVHPPSDPQRWADACVGIIKHYNEGWAQGYHYNIRYWEIWNEPENRPAMWSGSDADYFHLYKTTAQTIQRHDSRLKVGGPAVGDVGHVRSGTFTPSAFTRSFLAFVRQEQLPLHFFSWHTYTDSSDELVAKAHGVRALLDSLGFQKTESHLNEWNYLPDRNWDGMSNKASPNQRENYYKRMSGAEGAAFLAMSLMDLQDAPVDMCNLFHGEVGPFGFYSEQGAPQPNVFAWTAFDRLITGPVRRLEVKGAMAEAPAVKWRAIASQSTNNREIRLLFACTPAISSPNPGPPIEVRFTLKKRSSRTDSPVSKTVCDRLDATHSWSETTPQITSTPDGEVLVLSVTPPAVGLLRISP